MKSKNPHKKNHWKSPGRLTGVMLLSLLVAGTMMPVPCRGESVDTCERIKNLIVEVESIPNIESVTGKEKISELLSYGPEIIPELVRRKNPEPDNIINVIASNYSLVVSDDRHSDEALQFFHKYHAFDFVAVGLWQRRFFGDETQFDAIELIKDYPPPLSLPALITLLEENNMRVGGSESATIHSIFLNTMVNTIAEIIGHEEFIVSDDKQFGYALSPKGFTVFDRIKGVLENADEFMIEHGYISDCDRKLISALIDKINKSPEESTEYITELLSTGPVIIPFIRKLYYSEQGGEIVRTITNYHRALVSKDSRLDEEILDYFDRYRAHIFIALGLKHRQSFLQDKNFYALELLKKYPPEDVLPHLIANLKEFEPIELTLRTNPPAKYMVALINTTAEMIGCKDCRTNLNQWYFHLTEQQRISKTIQAAENYYENTGK